MGTLARPEQGRAAAGPNPAKVRSMPAGTLARPRPEAGAEPREGPARARSTGAGADRVQLRSDPVHQTEKQVQSSVRYEVVAPDLVMWRPPAIESANTLDETDRVPRQVVTDHVGGVLKVESLGQNVGCDQDIDLPDRVRPAAIGGRRESADDLEAAGRLITEERTATMDEPDAVLSPKRPPQVQRSVPELGEYQDLAAGQRVAQ
jgi:hypothetical protein